MIQYACYETEIRIWWDKREDKTENMRYRVVVDGRAYVLTDNHYYDFANLETGRAYTFEIQLIDEEKNIIGRREQIQLSTRAKREVIDVTLPPYNMVGDGETDNTEALNRALLDCREGKILYFPMGVYLCDKIDLSGTATVRFDAGAILQGVK